MVLESKWFAKVAEKLDEFCMLVDEKIDKEQRQLKASIKKTEIETKLAQEIKLHNELSERWAEISRRSTELDRICTSFAGVSIAESDQHRLDNAKESFGIAKEMTGIRFDFAAPPNIAKGFIKNESRKLLLPFEMDMSLEGNSDALWTLLQTTAAPGWPFMAENKENICNN